MNIDEVAAQYGLERARGDDLVAVALQLMEEGVDTPDIHLLAELPKGAPLRDAGPLFESVVAALGKIVPKREDAAVVLAKTHARAILEGKKGPVEGATEIAGLWSEAGQPVSLVQFVSIVDDLGETLTAFDQADGPLKAKKEEQLAILKNEVLAAVKELLSGGS